MLKKRIEFFIYLLENYAEHKGQAVSDVLQVLDKLNLTAFICYQMYEVYHVEAIENAYEDIDRLIAERSASAKPLD